MWLSKLQGPFLSVPIIRMIVVGGTGGGAASFSEMPMSTSFPRILSALLLRMPNATYLSLSVRPGTLNPKPLKYRGPKNYSFCPAYLIRLFYLTPYQLSAHSWAGPVRKGRSGAHIT